jgi:hypothetical protein
MTDARSPVPRLEGQVPRNPRRSFHINEAPLASADFLMACIQHSDCTQVWERQEEYVEEKRGKRSKESRRGDVSIEEIRGNKMRGEVSRLKLIMNKLRCREDVERVTEDKTRKRTINDDGEKYKNIQT